MFPVITGVVYVVPECNRVVAAGESYQETGDADEAVRLILCPAQIVVSFTIGGEGCGLKVTTNGSENP